MVMNKTPATNIINNNINQMNGHQNGQLANGKNVDNYAQELRIEQYKASLFKRIGISSPFTIYIRCRRTHIRSHCHQIEIERILLNACQLLFRLCHRTRRLMKCNSIFSFLNMDNAGTTSTSSRRRGSYSSAE